MRDILLPAERRLKGRRVAVGTTIARRPPHRPVLALLTHTVPTLEKGTPGPFQDRTHSRRTGVAGTVSSIGPILENLLGRPPSLHALRRRFPALVRALRWYYAVARLPAAVHGGLMAHRLLLPARLLPRAATGSPVLAHGVSLACLGSSTPRGRASLALSRMRVVAFRTG